jgi:hypothetical protein
MQFLEDYFRGAVCVASATLEKVHAYVAALPGITLEELLAKVEAFCSRDEVYFLIAHDRLGVDLWSTRLTEPGAVKVFASADLAKASAQTPHASLMPLSADLILGTGSAITWNGRPWKIVNVSPDKVSLLKDDLTVLELPRPAFEQLVRERSIVGSSAMQTNSEPLQRILKANEDELRRANQRYECVCRYLRGEREGFSTPIRTLRRWAARYREAERCLGSGFLGLFSDTAKRGNSGSKLPDATMSLMKEFIESDYETLNRIAKELIVFRWMASQCKSWRWEAGQ